MVSFQERYFLRFFLKFCIFRRLNPPSPYPIFIRFFLKFSIFLEAQPKIKRSWGIYGSPLATFWKSSNHTYKIEDWKSDVKELLWLWVTARCLGSTRSSFWAMTYPSTEVRWVKIPWQWPCHHHRFGCHGLPYISSSSLSFFSLRPKAGGSPNIILEFKPL